MRTPRKFTEAEDDFLRTNCLIIPTKRMSKMLDRSESCARQRMKLLGIIVPPEVIERFRKDSQIKPGAVPPNKGKKMSPELYEKCKNTMFKKGQVSLNKRPLGSMRVTKDGYIEIKTLEPNKWEAYHRLMWEETFGPIPEGKIVRFVTKDRMNVHPFNLELIDRKINMQRNSYHNYPKPLAKMVQLRGALNRQINKRLKKLNNEK